MSYILSVIVQMGKCFMMRKTHLQNNLQCRLINRRALANVVTSAIILSAVSVMGVAMMWWSNSNLAIQKQEIEGKVAQRNRKV